MLQLTIEHCDQDHAEMVTELLEALGAMAITLTDQQDDPILEPEPGSTPLWPQVILQALFEPQGQLESVIQTLSTQYPNLTYQIDTLPEQDWERTCLVDFKPLCFGKRLWVCPSWLSTPKQDTVNLILDPGLAFGTGTHPTTSLCLTWLDEQDLSNQSVIDYGCGSGILGIAALKLGAKRVYAVDIDEQALTATKNNAITNQIDLKTLSIEYPDALTKPADLILSNILLSPLIKLKQRFCELLNPNGTLVISGILASQSTELIDVYQSTFNLIASNREEDWAMLVFSKIN